jgi:predicted PurR-regulated permease PerM
VIGVSAGGVAAIIAAAVWGVLVLFLAFMVFRVALLIDSTTKMVDETRKNTMPLLQEVTTSVASVNKELERLDGMAESIGNIVKSAERVTNVVEQAVSSPLIKVAAFGAGASRMFRRLQKKKQDG